ncbi:MAG: hypothetical protein VX589_04800 [Myxococcota bacterium]|nr:hypothetical protein [Myxococcota bacterium]
MNMFFIDIFGDRRGLSLRQSQSVTISACGFAGQAFDSFDCLRHGVVGEILVRTIRDQAQVVNRASERDDPALDLEHAQPETRQQTAALEFVSYLIDAGAAQETSCGVYGDAEDLLATDSVTGIDLYNLPLVESPGHAQVTEGGQTKSIMLARRIGETLVPSPHVECMVTARMRGRPADLHWGLSTHCLDRRVLVKQDPLKPSTAACIWLESAPVEMAGQGVENLTPSWADVRYTSQVSKLLMIRSVHYRAPLPLSLNDFENAAGQMAYYYETLRKVEHFVEQSSGGSTAADPSMDVSFSKLHASFREALANDLDIPAAFRAIDAVFKLMNDGLAFRRPNQRSRALRFCRTAQQLIHDFDRVVQLFDASPKAYLAQHRSLAVHRSGLDPAWVNRQISHRSAARIGRDFKRADEILAELLASGVVVMDRTNGTTDWRIREGEVHNG